MTRAYNQLYLADAMHNIGTMLDYAVNTLHFDLSIFYEMFLASGVASQIESGNPRYISGLSGIELTKIVLEKASDRSAFDTNYILSERTNEYWTGWALVYYQWYTAYSFSFIQRNGLNISTIQSLYSTMHEADISKFVQTANRILQQQFDIRQNMLKVIRKRQHITQRELAGMSGVTLRMIQAYEQGDQDIRKAEAQTVFALSHALGCVPEILCER